MTYIVLKIDIKMYVFKDLMIENLKIEHFPSTAILNLIISILKYLLIGIDKILNLC